MKCKNKQCGKRARKEMLRIILGFNKDNTLITKDDGMVCVCKYCGMIYRLN